MKIRLTKIVDVLHMESTEEKKFSELQTTCLAEIATLTKAAEAKIVKDYGIGGATEQWKASLAHSPWELPQLVTLIRNYGFDVSID